MFIGEFTHSIDSKGRLAVPFRFRAKLTPGAAVTRGIDGCLFVYPKDEWERLAQKLGSLPLADAQARAFARLMLSGAAEVEFDGQGRILLPSYLRDWAQLSSQAVVVGVYNRLEIWNPSGWESYRKKADSEREQIEKHLSQLGV